MASCQLVTIYLLALALGAMSCQSPPALDLGKAALIPQPLSVVGTGSSFTLCPHTVIAVPRGADTLQQLGAYLQAQLAQRTGQAPKLVPFTQSPKGKAVALSLVPQDSLAPEAYRLQITEKQIGLLASRPAGLFRGLQTLLQLVPEAADPNKPEHRYLATGTITDEPLYAYRGMMLDVARHFFTVEEVKRVIDLIAYCKLNTLHLHLADDQGWRIEIKSWPRLATIGGRTEVGGGAGGYYTQAEYRELVEYAESRFITIVPEVDMPGHTNAALAAYPELNCDGVARELYTGTEVGFSTLCTQNERTYQFVEDVIRELSALTPGPYLHIGGDESHVTPLEAYVPFIERVQSIVRKYGKQMIGWDEISHAKLAEGAVVQYWAHADNARRGAAQGARILLSPAQQVYLDMQYDSTTRLGLHWAAYIEVDDAYRWVPETLVAGLPAVQILGIESPLWTETISSMDDIEYMVFPRLLGHAELSWSPASIRDWDHYRQRLAQFGPKLRAMGIHYYASPRVDWQ